MTVTAVSAVAPNFLQTLASGNSQAVRQLVAAIDRSNDPDTTPVLVWLLLKGDVRGYGSLIQHRVTQPPHVARLPIGELAGLLATVDPDHRVAIVDVFDRLFRLKARPEERPRMIAALIGCVSDPDIDVRRRALETLGAARATVPLPVLISAFDRPDVTQYFAKQVIYALKATAHRDALPVLERWARSAGTPALRFEAAIAYITIARPADPAGEARRLLWEPVDTAIERRVLAEGRRALPLAWEALSSGSSSERRAAAALLGWFPDRRSIGPILAALDRLPGALTRDQLLFDLNMILLMEGIPADSNQRNALAAEHLRWLSGQLAAQNVPSEIRSAMLARPTLAVFPDRVVAPFSADLPGFSATAVRSASPEAFRQWVAKDGSGIAFHAITVAEGVARVAATLYLPHGVTANQMWIGLYQREGDRWVPLPTRPHVMVNSNMNGANLRPTIRRNYGQDDPWKILELDLQMERIRVDLAARHVLRNADRQYHGNADGLDASYVRLLERYRRSDSLSVRVMAEYELGRLTGQPDIQFWIDTLEQHVDTPYQAMAQEVVGGYALRELETQGRELAGAERKRLVGAALVPQAIDPRLMPTPLAGAEDMRHVQRSNRFGLVAVVFGSGRGGRRALSGYSMLFERRGEDWVFLFIVKSWIS